MIDWILAFFLVLAFVALLEVFGLVERGRQVVEIARKSIETIGNKELDDDAKEAALQRDAKRLFVLFFILTAGGAAALAIPMGVIWVLDWLGLASLDAVVDVSISVEFIIAGSVVGIAGMVIASRNRRSTSSYSSVDRTMHRIAFKTYRMQIPMAEVETDLYADELKKCSADRPVFITALPRAGTTMVLEFLAPLPDFAAHCYRDMPFILTPCLWDRFTSMFKRSSELRERAHGDGMLINADSPEALEEVLWKTFWRKHYGSDRIALWPDSEHEEFEQFFRSHMRKIVLLRSGEEDPATVRYVSKNNLNISRIGWLLSHFPDGTVVVPFRDPTQHAMSLLRQHANFLKIHEEDPFASLYMRAIGHFDFGENLRPVDFDGWLDSRKTEKPADIGFWIEYWVAGYRHLLQKFDDNIRFLHYEGLCEHPERGLQALADTVDTRSASQLVSAAADIHAPRPRDVDTSGVPAEILRGAEDLHAELQKAAVNR